MEDIISAFNNVFEDKVLKIDDTPGSQNEVYLLTTNTNRYIVKKFIVFSESDIEERKEQLRISKIWNDNGIPCIQPLTDIFEYKDNYYIIYPFMDGMNLNEGELTLEQIVKLARLQAKMHLLQIDTWLPCHIKFIDFKNSRIQNIIDECNKSVDVANSNLCVCDNDYKPLNIVWHDNKPYLLDFDAVCKNHPTFSLVESAYTFCHNNNELNMDYYKEYIKEYKKTYGKELKDVDSAIYGSWNGKIQWVKFLGDNRPNDNGINDLICQMIRYQNYVEDIKKILLDN